MQTITLKYNNLIVEVYDDPSFTRTSESPTSYDVIVQADEDKKYVPSSQHAIKIYKDHKVVKAGIVLASGGGTGIHEDSALIDEGNLIIRCCNKLFSVTLPDLEVNWWVDADYATCFSVHQYQDTYITHGELSIARIDRNGKILWSRTGADIFVCLYEGNPFEMLENYIQMTDFAGGVYRIGYDGGLISYDPVPSINERMIKTEFTPKRKWWKFW